MFDTIFIVLHLMTVTKSENDVGTLFEVEENRFLFNETTIWNGKLGSLLACSQTCARRDDCSGAIFWPDHDMEHVHFSAKDVREILTSF